MSLDWKGDAILAGVSAAFEDANDIFGRSAQKEITDDKWPWPRGESPRDIVDQGGLRNSYTPRRISATEYEHAWTVDYALAVHEGAVGAQGALPGRPWTKAPLVELPDVFERLVRAKLARTT